MVTDTTPAAGAAPADALRAGVVGLGMIGGGVAVSLARSGRTPAVYDIRTDAADTLEGVPSPLGSPAEVARASDVIMVAVVDADQARAVISGPEGLTAGAHPGMTVVLLSTVALPVVRELAAECEEFGTEFLDCGVTPGDKAAEHGLLALAGGSPDAVERARPVLRDWAKQIVHCGPQGAGMATKIARNVVTYGSWRAVAEAATLVKAAGVDPRTLADAVTAADPEGRTLLQLLMLQQGAATGELPPHLAGRPQALFRQIDALMRKDLDAARELSAGLGISSPLVEVAREHTARTVGLELDTAGGVTGGAEGGTTGGAAAGEKLPQDPRERGLLMMDRVYGEGFGTRAMPASGDPFTDDTVEHLFADIWSRPDLSVRDRRLLTLGATAATGRAGLVRIQTEGALANGELSPEQLGEAALHLAYYVGWGNATATRQGITEALAARGTQNSQSTRESTHTAQEEL